QRRRVVRDVRAGEGVGAAAGRLLAVARAGRARGDRGGVVVLHERGRHGAVAHVGDVPGDERRLLRVRLERCTAAVDATVRGGAGRGLARGGGERQARRGHDGQSARKAHYTKTHSFSLHVR